MKFDLDRRRVLGGLFAAGVSFALAPEARARPMPRIKVEGHPLQGFFEQTGIDSQWLEEPYEIAGPKWQVKGHLIKVVGSDEILSQENADVPMHPASTSKTFLPVIYNIMDRQGLLAGQSSGWRNKMDRYLHQAMIYSSNGSATRFAEELTNVAAVKDYCRTRGLTPGTQWAYGQILVDPIARSLGMNSTSYRNASGLPGKTYTGTPYNVTTLEDKAKLYDFALSEFSKEILDITSQVSYRGVLNTNKMLETAGSKFATEGNDGLKTGFTEGARYNFDATLLRSNIRYQTQVSGRPDINSRFADTIDLAEMAIGAHEAQLEAVKTQRRFGVPFAAEFEGRIVDAMGLAIP